MDSQLQELIEEYKALTNGEKEGDLAEVVRKFDERKYHLIENEGHDGLS